MKIDTSLKHPDLQALPALAQRLEHMGFDGLWSNETSHDPFLSAGIAALHTKRVHLGTNIAIAFARAPWVTAQIAWDLQAFSGGRFGLGLGTQVRAHVERRFSMPFDRPASRLRDYVRCMQAIWDTFQHGTPPAYEGEFYNFKLINPAVTPGPLPQPHIPVYIAGVNPPLARVAGEVADGFQVHSFHSAGYLRDVLRKAIDEGARSRGKTAADLAFYGSVFAVSAETQAETDRVEREVRRQIAFYASTPQYRGVLEYHGFEGIAKELSRMARGGEWDAMTDKITDAMLEQFAVVAPPAQLARVIRERYEGLLDRFALYDPVQPHDPEERWRRLVQGIHAA